MSNENTESEAVAVRRVVLSRPNRRSGYIHNQEYRKGSSWLYMYSMQDDRQKILVVCSFSDRVQKFRPPKEFHLDKGKRILCNYPEPEEDRLNPYEARVYFWN